MLEAGVWGLDAHDVQKTTRMSHWKVVSGEYRSDLSITYGPGAKPLLRNIMSVARCPTESFNELKGRLP